MKTRLLLVFWMICYMPKFVWAFLCLACRTGLPSVWNCAFEAAVKKATGIDLKPMAGPPLYDELTGGMRPRTHREDCGCPSKN